MWLKTGEIEVPDVRVTSSWEPELLAMFKESIKAEGIVVPLWVLQEGEHKWLVDGLHRLEEAKLNNEPRVRAVVVPGALVDVYLKNLFINRLHGKTKASEMAMVVKELMEKHGMDMDSIARKTGLKRDYIEKLSVIGRVTPEILRDLDSERIHLGHAYEIGRVQDPDVQLRLLIQTKQFDLTVTDLKDVVDKTLEIIKERDQNPEQPPRAAPLPPSTIKCHFCEMDRPINQTRGFNVCQWCFSIAYEAVAKAKAVAQPQPAETPPAAPGELGGHET